ncbi:hypothetical protein XENOCAPTIV_025225 [Xenoophorus captivus]|uniref:Uncharacterized protein n=1 Tax=Xenoophorus captivus TaxID=1517983 RepID=A0ABV0R278_9TELE
MKRQGHKETQVLSKINQDREHWYGSDEFLALPAQLHETEMLAVKLESLIQSSSLNQIGLQDVDDWELSDLNVDWDIGESGVNMRNVWESRNYITSPLPSLRPHIQNSVSCFSSNSSCDIGPSVEESIESGPLSDLFSEKDDRRRSVDGSQHLTAPLVDGHGSASLMKKLLEDMKDQNKDVWRKMEVILLHTISIFVLKLSLSMLVISITVCLYYMTRIDSENCLGCFCFSYSL